MLAICYSFREAHCALTNFLMPHAVMWSIFIGVHYNNQQVNFWTTYVSETVLRMLCPAFGITGLFLVLNVLTYASVGQIDFRVLYCYMLVSVKIVTGELIHPPNLTFKFWAIVDVFFLRLRSPRGNPRQLRYYIDRTPATYFLASFIFLTFTGAAWLGLEAMLVDSLTITTPVTEDECRGYTCLRGLTPISCSEVLNITGNLNLFCVMSGIQFNILDSSYELIAALILYIAAVQLLKYIVAIVSILLRIYHTKIWGLVLLIIHILLFITMLAIAIEVDSIDILSKVKLVAIPILFIPMDFLLLSGGIKEVIQEPQRTRCIIVKPRHYFRGVRHMNRLAGLLSPQSRV